MKIKCSVCKQEFGCRKEIYEKRIKAYGSEEKLLKNYKCKDCRKTKPTTGSKIKVVGKEPEKKE